MQTYPSPLRRPSTGGRPLELDGSQTSQAAFMDPGGDDSLVTNSHTTGLLAAGPIDDQASLGSFRTVGRTSTPTSSRLISQTELPSDQAVGNPYAEGLKNTQGDLSTRVPLNDQSSAQIPLRNPFADALESENARPGALQHQDDTVRNSRNSFRRHNDLDSYEPDEDAESRTPSTRMWLGNIAAHVSTKALFNVFEAFGEVEDGAVFPARIGPLGYAFVNFKDINAALKAYEQLNNTAVAPLTGNKVLKMRYKSSEAFKAGRNKHARQAVMRATQTLQLQRMSQQINQQAQIQQYQDTLRTTSVPLGHVQGQLPFDSLNQLESLSGGLTSLSLPQLSLPPMGAGSLSQGGLAGYLGHASGGSGQTNASSINSRDTLYNQLVANAAASTFNQGSQNQGLPPLSDNALLELLNMQNNLGNKNNIPGILPQLSLPAQLPQSPFPGLRGQQDLLSQHGLNLAQLNQPQADSNQLGQSQQAWALLEERVRNMSLQDQLRNYSLPSALDNSNPVGSLSGSGTARNFSTGDDLQQRLGQDSRHGGREYISSRPSLQFQELRLQQAGVDTSTMTATQVEQAFFDCGFN